MISMSITMVTTHFLMRLHEIKTLHHGVRDLDSPWGLKLPNLNNFNGVRVQIL